MAAVAAAVAVLFRGWLVVLQGLTADKALVLADLVDGQGKHRGPHAFFIDMRQHGRLVAGITVGDMGRKTIVSTSFFF